MGGRLETSCAVPRTRRCMPCAPAQRSSGHQPVPHWMASLIPSPPTARAPGCRAAGCRTAPPERPPEARAARGRRCALPGQRGVETEPAFAHCAPPALAARMLGRPRMCRASMEPASLEQRAKLAEMVLAVCGSRRTPSAPTPATGLQDVERATGGQMAAEDRRGELVVADGGEVDVEISAAGLVPRPRGVRLLRFIQARDHVGAQILLGAHAAPLTA